jgi:hypothetical protein
MSSVKKQHYDPVKYYWMLAISANNDRIGFPLINKGEKMECKHCRKWHLPFNPCIPKVPGDR